MQARHCLYAIVLGLIVGLAAPAQAASFLEKNFWLSGPRYDGVMPTCDDPGPLGKITGQFATKEGRFWNSELRILGFDHIRQVAFRPWAENTIPRRFCTGRVMVSDGRRRTIHYWIGEDTGVIGMSYGVEWCVVGLDRNWAYNPSCKMALP